MNFKVVLCFFMLIVALVQAAPPPSTECTSNVDCRAVCARRMHAVRPLVTCVRGGCICRSIPFCRYENGYYNCHQ